MSENLENKDVIELGAIAQEAPVKAAGPVVPTAEDVKLITEEGKSSGKKKGKSGKVIKRILLVLLCLVFVLVIVAVGIVLLATSDDMPQSATDVSATDISEIISDAAFELISDEQISFESADIDYVLNQVKEMVNSSGNTAQTGEKSAGTVQIDDLFMVLANSKGTIYARAQVEYYGIKLTLPIQIAVRVDFVGNEVVCVVDSVKCGKLSIPMSIIEDALSTVNLPEELEIRNGSIYYDVSKLDEMVDTAIQEALDSRLPDWLKWVSGVATDIVNVTLTDARIDDNKLVITGSVF